MKKYDSIEERLELLKQVKRTAAPEFLYTRIQERIRNLEMQTVAPAWFWATALSFMLIIACNIAVIKKTGHHGNDEQGLQAVGQGLGLTSDNNLYD